MKILTYQMRKHIGMSLEELSEKTGISKSTLSNIDNERVSPTFKQMELIAEALGTKINALFTSKFK